MSTNPPTNTQTLVALVGIPVLGALVYAGFLQLSVFETLLTAVLGIFGIQAVLRLKRAGILDLFTVVSDKVLVGVDALATTAALYFLKLMPQADFLTFFALILGSLGIILSANKAKVASLSK